MTDDAVRRSLLVIDVQREYVDGALPIAHPPVAESVPKVLAAMRAAADAGVPVLLVEHRDDAGSPVFAAGSRGAELLPEVLELPHEAVLTKSTVSAFPGLRRRLSTTKLRRAWASTNIVQSPSFACDPWSLGRCSLSSSE